MAGFKKFSTRSVTRPTTAIVDVPDVPAIDTPTNTTTTAHVAFIPAATGGAAVSYTANAYIGGVLTSPLKSGTGTTSPVDITGLTVSTTYTFKVLATNTKGSSPLSGASSTLTI